MTGPGVFRDVDLLIGIDDTDNVSSRGTGWLAQHLIADLEGRGFGWCPGATRHQLLRDPRIPYTSHNSDACLTWHLAAGVGVQTIIDAVGEYLEVHSAAGSDPGLAVAAPQRLTPEDRERLVAFGRSAQTTVLEVAASRTLATETGVHLSGHGGTEDGVLGALAGVGLVLSGSDGLFLWMPGTRELPQRMTYRELCAAVPIDVARDPAGGVPAPDDEIELGDWVRPVLLDRRAVLLLSPREGTGAWSVAPRYVVRAH